MFHRLTQQLTESAPIGISLRCQNPSDCGNATSGVEAASAEINLKLGLTENLQRPLIGDGNDI